MTKTRLRQIVSDNPFSRLVNEALDGNVLAELVVGALIGSGLIVSWSFALVSSNDLLRASIPASTLNRPNVRVAAAVHNEVTALALPARTAPNHNTGTTASAPSRTVDVTAGETASSPLPRSATPHLVAIVRREAKKNGVPPHILAGLAEDESSWRPGAIGQNGEVGLLQLKAGTAAWCGMSVKDRRHAAQNAACAARYLAAQFATFGSWELAVVAFKAGPSRIPENIPASSWAYAQRALLRAEAYR